MEIRLSGYEIACIWVDFQYRAYIPQEDFVHYDRGTDARASFVAFGYQNKFETWLVIMVLTAEIQSSSTFKHCKYCVYRFVARILIASIKNILVIVFSCDQAALQMVFSVRLSVCPSVRLSVTPFWLCSHHRIIMKFSGVITSDRSDVHAKGQGQRSKVKVTEVTTQLYRFRTVTPVWIHIWWWNDAYSLIMLRRGALLFFKVICQISRSHGSKNRRIWPRLDVSGL